MTNWPSAAKWEKDTQMDADEYGKPNNDLAIIQRAKVAKEEAAAAMKKFQAIHKKCSEMK